MKNPNRSFLAILCCFFSLCAAMTAVAQKVQQLPTKKEVEIIKPEQIVKPRSAIIKDEIRVDHAVPAHAIGVNVRYRIEYGYHWAEGPSPSSGPTSCDEFIISARLEPDGARPQNELPIGGDSQMQESFGYYTCKYLVSDLPFNVPVKIIVTIPNNREAWQGGSQPQPPPGQERRIPDGNVTVTLTGAQPRATLTLEMIYAAIPPR